MRGTGLHVKPQHRDNLDNLAGNMNTKRLTITPATDTTDAVMESDTSRDCGRSGRTTA